MTCQRAGCGGAPQRGLNEVYTGGIGSYTLLTLVLAHLRTEATAVRDGLAEAAEVAAGDVGVLLRRFLRRFGVDMDPATTAVRCESRLALAPQPAHEHPPSHVAPSGHTPKGSGRILKFILSERSSLGSGKRLHHQNGHAPLHCHN
jgi:hypothetical protein